MFVGGLGAGIGLDRAATSADPVVSAGAAEFDLIRQAWELLEHEYVGAAEIDETDLAHGAIRGMTDAVGDTGHTDFMDPEERRTNSDSLSGRFVGVGIALADADGRAIIEEVFAGGPAAAAGLRPGDEIVAVDGKPITEPATEAVVERVRGPEGTDVVLTIARPGSDPFEARITRAAIDIPAVSWAMVPGTTIADVALRRFQAGAADELQKAHAAIDDAGATGLILDLRGNPGGYTGEALGIASQFLREGVVYRTENAKGQTAEFTVETKWAPTDLPLVVLVDESSASSSEIVAGALKDRGRATVVGVTTFGTGTVLGEYPLTDGSALRIGTVNWLTPNGTLIWHEGITPNEIVQLTDGARPLRSDRLRSLDPDALASSGDAQLLRALEILQGDA
jgi:carboxyl-terminal processing protease